MNLTQLKKECMDILQCEDPSSIKKAYYKQALLYHPDKNPNGKEQFNTIQKAYNLLTNEKELQKELEERINKENCTQKKIQTIIQFLNNNECSYQKGQPLHYYENLMKNLYDKIFYLIEYHWKIPWSKMRSINTFLFSTIRKTILTEKENIILMYNINPYNLNLNNVYLRAFLLHIIEERLYTQYIDNNILIDTLNFLEYFLEKTPPWNILT